MHSTRADSQESELLLSPSRMIAFLDAALKLITNDECEAVEVTIADGVKLKVYAEKSLGAGVVAAAPPVNLAPETTEQGDGAQVWRNGVYIGGSIPWAVSPSRPRLDTLNTGGTAL